MFVQPSPQWLLRHLPLLKNGPLQFFHSAFETHGEYVLLPLGRTKFHIVHDGDLLYDILVTQGRRFEKFPRIPADHGLFGNGLLTSEEPLHMKQRRLMQPHFHREQILGYGRIMTDCAQRMVEPYRDGEVRDLAQDLNRAALDIVSRSLFGADTQQEADLIGHELEVVLQMLNRLVLPGGALRMWLPLPSTIRYRLALRRLDAVVRRLIAQPDRTDLLSALAGARDEETGLAMSPQQLRDEAVTLLVAGHETTANALAWCVYLLSQSPDIRARLQAEIESVTGGGSVKAEHYPQLVYTESVLRESMRLFPSVWIVGRRALEDYQFRDIRVPAGAVFVTCLYSLHRNPRFWPEPDRFDPDRWQQEKKGRNAYFPFGAGSRMCLGERFAWMEGVLLLAALYQNWNLDLEPGQTVDPLGLLTLRPRFGLRMRIARRQ